MIDPIQAGSDSRKNWKTINALRQEVVELKRRLFPLENPNRRRFDLGSKVELPLFPYEGSTWLKWSLSTGYVAKAGAAVIPTAVDTEFTLTSGVAKFYFYIDHTSTPEVKTSSTALAWSSTLVPVAFVDTATYAAQSVAIPYPIEFVAAGGSSVQMYRVKSVQGDYVTCRTWDGTTEGGSDIYIAKPNKLRNSITGATIDGLTLSYTYANTTERDAYLVTGVTTWLETQIVLPRYDANAIIFAANANATGVSVSGSPLTLIDLNADGRAWARKYV